MVRYVEAHDSRVVRILLSGGKAEIGFDGLAGYEEVAVERYAIGCIERRCDWARSGNSAVRDWLYRQ